MCDLTFRVFDHLEITSPMDLDKRVAYTQRIIRGAALKNYREVLVACRQLEKELTGYEWNLRELAGLSTEVFWTLAKTYTTGYDEHNYLPLDKFVDFERELLFKLGKCMCRKH